MTIQRGSKAQREKSGAATRGKAQRERDRERRRMTQRASQRASQIAVLRRLTSVTLRKRHGDRETKRNTGRQRVMERKRDARARHVQTAELA